MQANSREAAKEYSPRRKPWVPAARPNQPRRGERESRAQNRDPKSFIPRAKCMIFTTQLHFAYTSLRKFLAPHRTKCRIQRRVYENSIHKLHQFLSPPCERPALD
jgi:hypothetical protein